MTQKPPSAPRCAAIVGPYLHGKTTLLESLLAASGTIARRGTVKEGNTVGDASPEARARQMSVEISAASARYLDEDWTFIDCPGSVELIQDAYNALMVADTAVIVCEPGVDKALTLSPLLRFLDDRKIPHMIFINKVDVSDMGVVETVEAVRDVSQTPLVLRMLPIVEDDRVVGHVDLAMERAFRWNPDNPSDPMDIPEAMADAVTEARTTMLETLADFDDDLLEKLLEDELPPTADVYANLTKVVQAGSVVPVFFGSALTSSGVRRLLKALRHETAEPAQTAGRLGIEPEGEPVARVFKTLHAAHTGKLTFVRVWRGEIADGMTLDGSRISGLFRMLGAKQEKQDTAGAGATVALGRMEDIATGALLSPSGKAEDPGWLEAVTPLYALAVHAEQRSDEVKLTGALAKLMDEDSSFSFEANKDTGQLLIWGQGEMHLQVAIDRLRNRYNLAALSGRPQVPYKETIRKPVSQHARHKKQSGGHGQFGDVHLDLKPLPRGSGFEFNNTITGGVVPKQYIPSVEAGVKDFLGRGPLGFPVVDLSVTLTDGQFHTVDSSDMAFRAAAALGMREGMPKCDPVLLEPIFQVELSIPNEFTSKIQRLVSGRRGQILGFDAKPGWSGWDEVSAHLPQAEMHDLINELRSITLGVGNFRWEFRHLQELSGRLAEQVVAERAKDD